ncbi:MAG: alpha/beta hydrolase [Lentilitoribacter sp.]
MDIDGVPIPADAVPLSVDKNSQFAGVWTGVWDGFLKTILIVEAIDGDNAKVIYAVADNPRAGFKAAWFRLDGKISNNKMTVSGARFQVHFTATKNGTLRAVFGDGFSFGIMHRQSLSALKQADAEIAWINSETKILPVQLFEDDKQIQLETVIFKPKGEGPFPLAVINHGSTGNGRDVNSFKNTWVNTWLADVLNEHGYIAAFPQRRGRGNSTGLYDEGFHENRDEGYSCNSAISIAGADRALEDLNAAIAALQLENDVNSGPVLLAGQSRGGALSIAYAGVHNDQVNGVINFVGGWSGELCETAQEINHNIFKRGGDFTGDTLWLYGQQDVFYSIEHSRSNFDAFTEAGGIGEFLDYKIRGENNGHWLMFIPPLWQAQLERYLSQMKR